VPHDGHCRGDAAIANLKRSSAAVRRSNLWGKEVERDPIFGVQRGRREFEDDKENGEKIISCL